MADGMTWRTVLGACALLLASACARPPETPPGPTPLRFGMDVWPGYFPALIARDRGLMAANGVDLEVVPARDTNALMAEFAAGRYDLIAVSLGDAITLSRSRPDVMVLLVADESAGGDQLLARPGADLDARPLRLGTNLGGFGELFVRRWLEMRRIDPAHVTWTNVDASEVPVALERGAIDLGHTWKPYASSAAAKGATPVFTSADTPGLILDVVLTTRESMQRHPEALRGFVRAWFDAVEAWRRDPDAGRAAAMPVFGPAGATASLAGIHLYDLADNRQAMAGGAEAPLARLIDTYAGFFLDQGALAMPPVAEVMFDPTVLPDDTGPTR